MARTGMPISEQMPLANVKNRLSEVLDREALAEFSTADVPVLTKDDALRLIAER
jgi:hypothetical protein